MIGPQSIDLRLNRRNPWLDMERAERAGLDELGNVLVREPDDADVETTELEQPRGPPVVRRSAVRVDDVRRKVLELGEWDELVTQVLLAPVEVVVAKPVQLEAHHVHELDRRRVAEEGGDRRRSADCVAGGHGEVAVACLRAIPVEPWREERRPADGEHRVSCTAATEVVRGLGQRDQLAVVVADVEDGDLNEVVAALHDVVEDLSAGVLRTWDAHQVREGRRKVDGTNLRDRVGDVPDAVTAGDEGAMHVDVALEVDQIRQVAMLAKEIGRAS